MEPGTLFGIPLIFVGFVCFLLSLLFLYVWPKTKAQPYKLLSWPGYILHYFHPLAWLLFGFAAFIQPREPTISAILAGVGAVMYVVFIVLLVRT